MPVFKYKAVNAVGRTIAGKKNVSDPALLLPQLEADGLFLVSFQESKLQKGMFRARMSNQELLEFTSNLKAMIESGIGLLEALECLASDAPNKQVEEVFHAISEEISNGTSLSKALKSYPKLFPSLYIHTVAIGEETGSLSYVLGQMIDFLEWKIRLKADIQQAMIYPAFLVVATISVVTLLMTFVIPRFAEVLKDMNVPLPPITLAVMGISHLFVTQWPLILAALIGMIMLYLFLNRIPSTRYVIDSIKLEIPVIGPFLRSVAIARFVKNLMVPYAAGIEILSALELMEKTIGNSCFERASKEIREQIRVGGSLAEGIRKSKLFPRRVILMLEVGERVGKLEVTLEQVGKQYDESLPRMVKRVMSILEPAFLLVNAAIVLTVALSVILPIYSVKII